MFLLKDKIFELFGYRDAINDVPKVDGKGFLQRFNEVLAEDMDENELNKIINLLSNLMDPGTILDKFIPLRNDHFGMETYFGSEYSTMRKILSILAQLYKAKGTKLGYQVLFRVIGITGEFTLLEYGLDTGFDSSITLDDPVRRLDSFNATCSPYSITLTGTLPLTSELVAMIANVIRFNEPINAKLISLTYNGSVINYVSQGRDFNESFAAAFA